MGKNQEEPAKISVSNPYQFWIECSIAILAVLNLGLVFFDLTYLLMRSFYLQVIPNLVKVYDPVKGIRPHPETQSYLESVAILESQVAQTGVRATEVETLLAELRSRSLMLIQDSPFPGNNKDNLEMIKQNMRSRTGAESSRAAFARFWSQDFLTQRGWQSEIEFWHSQIRPLMNANYYRQVNKFGHFSDRFWLLDLPFVMIFALEIGIRVWGIRRRHPELSWLESTLRRHYDLFLLFPLWRWLRVIPVSIQLHQVGWLNLEPLQAQARRDFALNFAKEMTEVVGVQVIDQIQASIHRGDVMRWFLEPKVPKNYVQVNEGNEVKAIAILLADISIHQVLPQLKPDLEAFIHYSLCNTFGKLPGCRQLKHLPGISKLSKQMRVSLERNLVKRLQKLLESAYQNIVQTSENSEMNQITTRLLQNFRAALVVELQKEDNTQEIERLLIALFEEIKINYVKGTTEVRIESVVDEAEKLKAEQKLEGLKDVSLG